VPVILSVLDQSPIPEGSTAAEALHNTLDLAARREAAPPPGVFAAAMSDPSLIGRHGRTSHRQRDPDRPLILPT
jgi:hypothetical protein